MRHGGRSRHVLTHPCRSVRTFAAGLLPRAASVKGCAGACETGRRRREASGRRTLRIRRRASAATTDGLTAAAAFDAFISYSHAVDGKLAPALQAGLHRFAKPWYRLRALRVFRDETSLSASPELWPSIVEALDRSRWFILLASPEAAKSKWVNDEVEHWCKDRSTKHVIVVVTKDVRDGDFDWEQTTSFPPALRAALEQEPRVVDLRWARDEADVSLHNARFRDAVADVAAPLHGRAKDELSGEDVRQHRRAIRLARSGVAALALLALVAATAAVLALISRNREAAQARLATSRQLAAESRAALGDGRLDLALLLGAQSYETQRTAEARSVLFEALAASGSLERFLYERPIAHSTVSGDGRRLAVVRTDGRVRIWDLAAGRPLGPPLRVSKEPTSIALNYEGGQLAVGVQGHPYVWDVQRRRWDPRLGEPASTRAFPRPVTSLAVGRRGTPVAWMGGRVSAERVGIWNGRSTEYLNTLGHACQVLINADASLVAVVLTLGFVEVWRLAPSGVPSERVELLRMSGVTPLSDECEPKGRATFSPTQPELLAIGGWDGVIQLFDARQGRAPKSSLRGGQGVVSSLAFSRDGRRIAARDSRGLLVGSVDSPSPLTDAIARSSGDAGLGFGPDSSVVAAVGSSGTVALSDVDGRRFQLASKLNAGTRVWSGAFSPDGTTLALGLNKGVRLWEVASRRPRTTTLLTAFVFPRVTFRSDGRRLAVEEGITRTVAAIDVARRARVGKPVTLPEGVEFAGFGRDGGLVGIRAGNDGSTVWRPGAAGNAVPVVPGRGVWDPETGRRVGNRLPRSVLSSALTAWSKNRAMLASAFGDGTISLWNARTGARVAVLAGARSPKRLAFSEEGELLAVLVVREQLSITSNSELHVWDVPRRSLLGVQRLADWAPDIRVFDFSRNDVLALTGSRSDELMLWDLEPDHWAETACRLAGRRLSEAEWERFLGTADYAPACSP